MSVAARRAVGFDGVSCSVNQSNSGESTSGVRCLRLRNACVGWLGMIILLEISGCLLARWFVLGGDL